MTHQTLIAMARGIATANGDDFDALPESKQEWVHARGMFGGRFRDVNEPRKSDYVAMALAALQSLAEQEPSDDVIRSLIGSSPHEHDITIMLRAWVKECSDE